MRRLLVLAVPALLLVGCGDGGADEVAGDGTTTTAADEAPSTCDDLTASVLTVVADPGPRDDSGGEGPTAEELAEYEAAGAALDRLASDGPEAVRDDAAALAAVFAVDPDEADHSDLGAVEDAAERLVAWGADTCPLDGPVWRCVARGTFRLVGEPIGDEAVPSLPEAPEDVIGGADIDPAWARVEVERTDDRVTFAWLDATGLAVYSATAEAGGNGGWRLDQTTSCDTGEDLSPDEAPSEGFAPIDPADLPPGSSTSVP